MRLHHAPYSSNSRRVTITLGLLGLPFDETVVDLRSAADRAALRTINPNEKIPVLEDGDFVLWESHAIVRYLCDKTPGQTLYPAELRARAEVDRWMFWAASHLAPAVAGFSFEYIVKPMLGKGEPDPVALQRAEAAFHPFAKVLDGHLAGRTWLAGSAPTLADISVACTLMHAELAHYPLAPYPSIAALRARVAELDAWKRTQPAALFGSR